MAKRARGTPTRPGQRAPLRRTSSTRPASESTTAAVKPTTLTPEEEARAAELEAQIVAQEKASETQTRRERERAKRAADEPIARGGTIAVRAAEEYAYVMRDVRRIVIIGGGLIVLLIGLWAVITATGIGPF